MVVDMRFRHPFSRARRSKSQSAHAYPCGASSQHVHSPRRRCCASLSGEVHRHVLHEEYQWSYKLTSFLDSPAITASKAMQGDGCECSRSIERVKQCNRGNRTVAVQVARITNVSRARTSTDWGTSPCRDIAPEKISGLQS